MVKIKKRMFIIREVKTNEIVFNYKTPAGNVKKAFFNKLEHAEKVVEDMPNWYVSSIE